MSIKKFVFFLHCRELMNIIKMMLSTLIKSLPQEATANNVIRHVLNIVREEYDLGFKVSSYMLHVFCSLMWFYAEQRGTAEFTLLNHW